MLQFLIIGMIYLSGGFVCLDQFLFTGFQFGERVFNIFFMRFFKFRKRFVLCLVHGILRFLRALVQSRFDLFRECFLQLDQNILRCFHRPENEIKRRVSRTSRYI